MAFESSSPSAKSEWIYDVFINFRGVDTRKKFVSHLHSSLSKAGVKTFLDEENLLKGMELQELLRAIQVSQIAIVVFSKRYAESSWCLDELQKIFQCRQTCGLRVVPVFYYVEPSEVRHQTGDFGDALRAAAESSYAGEHLEFALSSWRRTLTDAANLSGWNATDRRTEAELVRDIVNHVIANLDYNAFSITKFPVGLDHPVQEVIRFIERTKGCCKIGIWGMGGSGKTTIAKVIYNKLHRLFENKSFIENIREVCQTDRRRGLVRLQEKLLSDILKVKVEIQNAGIGQGMIDNRFIGKKALIVLDDVNEFDQLEALCGNTEWMGERSVIIITTRDLHLLKRFEVNYVYEMKEMEVDESLELFSRHAFREAKPREDFNEVAKDAVSYCGGLPLALEVLGSYLSNRTMTEWRSVLSKLKISPNTQVQEKLRISFDNLCDQMEKEIFLDVCCVFIGKDRGCVTEVLNGCGLYADIGITVLLERGLIKVEKNNKLRMHHLLQDMGREIIRELSRKEPGKRSRLWFQEDGTDAVEGLALKLNLNNRECFKADAFEEMRSLRLLQLHHVELMGDYGHLSKQLRWICWQGFPSKHIPENFYLEDAIAINFKHSNLRQVWKEPKVLLMLKFLNLSHSKYLTETPDFSGLPYLEKLILKYCPSLRCVHKSIGDLCNIVLINLKNCTSLSSLPREIYKLKSLKTLILSGCTKIDKLEEDIAEMKSLTTLIAENAVVKVPFSIVSSKSIGYLFPCGFEGLSHDVLPSIIWCWLSPTMNPLSSTLPLCGISASLVSMNMQNIDLGDLAPILTNLLNLRSVWVQCDTEFQITKQVRKILNDVGWVHFTELGIASCTSEISDNSLRSYLIGIGSYQEEDFNTLNKSISKELATSGSCHVFLPGGNYPFWLAHTGEGHSVSFTVPQDWDMKGMALCVLYLATPETAATECLISVVMVNYTKYTIQLYKRDTVISFNDADWQGIISHLEAGDEVEIFLSFRNELVIKNTAVYLINYEFIDMEVKAVSKPPVMKVYSRKRNLTDQESSRKRQW
ncbi:TMV resistance protein N-like isoform X2 [Vigna radiata var. radiata]|uniref:TMV resistance protein N-like isoform X2 n=1 Tax=Vigna radiata var. radiata TaxID=3916 RepID=A0A3Q0FCJ7_VIGRR|nr:TMV resistance protein N-like isoform X2 [Vigna radiata var. radiata]